MRVSTPEIRPAASDAAAPTGLLRGRTHPPEGPADDLDALLASATRLRHVAHGILDDRDLAEDAVQEAMITLWKSQTVPPSPTGWLFRTIVHRSLHVRRTEHRREHYERAAGQARLDDERGPVGDDPFDEVAGEQLAERLQAAIAALPPAQQAVLVLREQDDLDYEGIARLLDLPIGTVRSRLNRARRALAGAVRDIAGPAQR